MAKQDDKVPRSRIVRELGFGNLLHRHGDGSATTREEIVFIGPCSCRERPQYDEATESEVREFIGYWLNQIEVAQDYLANGRNKNTHEWDEKARKKERRYTTAELGGFGEPVAILNDGHSRFYIDDGCYVLFNDRGTPEGSWRMSSWLFPEAVAVLCNLLAAAPKSRHEAEKGAPPSP